MKVISGGQTGADMGGLAGARSAGIETGGTAPPDFMTDEGPNEDYLRSYGLIEGPYDCDIYPKRTQLNVLHADGTVLFGKLTSRGTILTLKYLEQYGKPKLVNPDKEELAHFTRS